MWTSFLDQKVIGFWKRELAYAGGQGNPGMEPERRAKSGVDGGRKTASP
ncbi:MAG TPA: hypothetical protein VKV74_08705 [Bryobacteraceae bacterium]|nr:hypothetical protein [Bryobacteraceae bacterium]